MARLEQFIEYFPIEALENEEIMKVLRDAFEKCNAKAFNHQVKKENKTYAKIVNHLNGIDRTLVYSTKVGLVDDGKESVFHYFFVKDSDNQNDFTLVSDMRRSIVYISGRLNNLKVDVIGLPYKGLYINKSDIRPITKKKLLNDIEKSITDFETFTRFNKARYVEKIKNSPNYANQTSETTEEKTQEDGLTK